MLTGKSFSTRFFSGSLLAVLLWAVPAPAAAGPRRTPAGISPLSDSLRKTRKVPDSSARDNFRNFATKTGAGTWRVRYNPKTALPEAIVGAKTPAYQGIPAQAALAFLNDNKDLLKVDVSQLRQAYSKVLMGVTHIQYEQVYNSVPVEFAYVRVHVGSSGEITGYQAKFEPDINVPLTPAFPAASAKIAVLSDLGFSARVTSETLVLFPDPAADGSLKLAWKIRARAVSTASGVWLYYVGAQEGKILFRYNDLRYVCSTNANNNYSTGTVRGAVYPISPIPSGTGATWESPVTKSINNQYVWITDTLVSPPARVTSVNGEYCGAVAGKVFASLKGPYFSVVNFRGPGAHFDNGNGEWRGAATKRESLHPYANSPNSPVNYEPVSITDNWSGSGYAFAKVMPHFSSFTVGEMDPDPRYQEGGITDSDELHVKNGTTTIASYIGTRSQPFFGAAVENTTYGLSLETDEAGTFYGFSVDISSYMVLKDNPTVRDNSTGSIVWSTNTSRVILDPSLGTNEYALAEINVFYHLNAAYDYFKLINKDPKGTGSSPTPAYLDKQVPVMVRAHGAADTIEEVGGMKNGFYDLEKDNIFLGDGPLAGGKYRPFALDGTIIRHEYTHRVVNQIYPIINFGEFGALSEAMADYFSLASLINDDPAATISSLGNFVGVGEGTARDLAGAAKSMPADWAGEVHDDSLILSQALWTLKKDPDTVNKSLGNFSSGYFNGFSKTDILVYAALFYFPDNFANFYDAMMDACDQLFTLTTGSCGAADKSKITSAFNAHGIPAYSTSTYSTNNDIYDKPGPGTPGCDNNNGPECATDVSTMTSLSATIYPAGDVDYYTIPLQEGAFTAVLTLPEKPAKPGYYYAYALFLFDALRKIVLYPDGTEVIAKPVITNNYYNYCNLSGDCLTNSPSVSLSYSITSPGRYYLAVSGALNQYSANSPVSSTHTYSLNLSYAPRGTATAEIYTALYDQDTIEFSVPYAKFPMAVAPSSDSLTGNESVFECAQLRDHNFQPLTDTRACGASGLYLTVDTPLPTGRTLSGGKTVIEGKVRLKPGFAARYPGVGTVYLEVFGSNHMGKNNVVSLGVSNAINLTADKSDFVTYNNIIKDTGDRVIAKYDLLSAGALTIKIYTVSGSLVKTVFSGSVSAGKGTIEWDGTNSGGSKAASGIYYIKAIGPGLDKVDKIAVVR